MGNPFVLSSKMELPVINHKDYFAKIGDDHKFPINKFGELANYLINRNIVKKFHTPSSMFRRDFKKSSFRKLYKTCKKQNIRSKNYKKNWFSISR